jgi:hypothetical protein
LRAAALGALFVFAAFILVDPLEAAALPGCGSISRQRGFFNSPA